MCDYLLQACIIIIINQATHGKARDSYFDCFTGKFHQAIFAIQRSVANEFALGATETSLKDRLADLRKFLKVATAGGSIDFARATLGKELYVFMKVRCLLSDDWISLRAVNSFPTPEK